MKNNKDFYTVFSSEDIGQYPFTQNVKFFTVLGWTNINLLVENEEFSILKKYLEEKEILEIYIKLKNSLEIQKFDAQTFLFDEYRSNFLGKGSHFIFWGQDNHGIVVSEDYFALIGGEKEFIEKFINGIGDKFYRRLKDFILEWDGFDEKSWANHLLRRENIILESENE